MSKLTTTEVKFNPPLEDLDSIVQTMEDLLRQHGPTPKIRLQLTMSGKLKSITLLYSESTT